MNNNSLFNKEAFAELIEKAKGDRTINQYANETGVSAAHISRLLRQMIDSPPSPDTISKFTANAYNGVTYKDMMIAAGYILRDSNMEEDSPRKRMEELRRIEEKIFQVIIADLMARDFKWSMDKPEGRIRFPDLLINIEDGYYKRWFFEFKATRSSNVPPFSIIHNFYGRLLAFELLPTDKFTIVINDERTYNFMIARPPINLRANLYVMLVDLENGRVIKEEKLSEY